MAALRRLLHAALVALVPLWAVSLPAHAADEAQLQRGEYLFNAGGCTSCHTDAKANGPLLAGGRGLKTPFGVFYGPNITPHPTAGIGKWTDADFIRAMHQGRDEDGDYLFPVFPYTSFTFMTDADLLDLKAYLFSLPPIDRPSRAHNVGFPFSIRLLQIGWRMLNFTPGPFRPDPKASAEVNRGAYLVRAVVHCGECHTPRDLTGGIESAKWLAGTANGPEGEKAPNITPDPETGIGKWSVSDITYYLKTGSDPEGDSAGSLMAEVVEHSTSKLTDADRAAIAAYLKQIPPITNKIRSAQH